MVIAQHAAEITLDDPDVQGQYEIRMPRLQLLWNKIENSPQLLWLLLKESITECSEFRT
jgi:hypothetical protein